MASMKNIPLKPPPIPLEHPFDPPTSTLQLLAYYFSGSPIWPLAFAPALTPPAYLACLGVNDSDSDDGKQQ